MLTMAPVTCLLCLDENSLLAREYIDIHSIKGTQLEVTKILNQHFHLNLVESHRESRKICSRCWKTVFDFHTLYEFVSAAQSSLQETKVLLMEDDPLTQGNYGESPKLSIGEPSQVQLQPNEGNLFYPEIKIEEHELDQLPKIEVLENTTNVQPRKESGNTRRLRRRGKTETVNTNSEPKTVGEIEPTLIPAEVPITPIKRRGRPRKVQIPVEVPNNNVQIDKPVAPSVKSEEPAEFSDEETEFGNMDPDFLHSDGGSNNSTSSNEEDDEDDSDFEVAKPVSTEFAVIPKRVVVRPKKYKKRAKPLEPKARMSKEMLEQRKAQQKEYDDIIAKFFNNVLPCSVCDLLVHNFTEMQRHHRLTHQIDPGYMMCCGRKFTQRKVLAEHVLVHGDPDHFRCDSCGKSFQNSRHLESHQRVHSDESSKLMFHCDQCPKVFLSKTAIDYHKLNKHVPKSEFKFGCTECNKRFLTERKLKNHMSSMHDPESTIICDKCGKQMRTKIILKKHQELMHSDKPRPEPELKQCQICGAWLKGITGLKQHMKSIHVESAGEHRCHVCDKVSPNARALRRHIYHNHECERKFKCTMCDKAFKRPQELREHTSTHTGEVLYTCPNCPMTFFCSANMYKHRQRLHRAQYEADKNQPRPPNILQQAVGATAAMKIKLMQNLSTSTPPLPDMEADMKHF